MLDHRPLPTQETVGDFLRAEADDPGPLLATSSSLDLDNPREMCLHSSLLSIVVALQYVMFG